MSQEQYEPHIDLLTCSYLDSDPVTGLPAPYEAAPVNDAPFLARIAVPSILTVFIGVICCLWYFQRPL